MSFFRSIAIACAPVAAITALLVATNAEAEQYRSGTINGYQAEILDSGSYDKPDFISIYGPAGREQILVTCAPFDWRSKGPNSADFVDSIAREWCF